MTWLVIGLGNPGPGYAAHRHNVGAMVVTELARRAGLDEAELRRAREEALPQIPEECRRLVAEDRVIEAIKAYREHTGAGLVEAKDAIDAHRAARA